MRITLAIVIVVGLIGSACGTKPKLTEAKPPIVTGIRIEKVTSELIDESYEATGTVRTKTLTVLSAQIMGTVTSLRVGEGDKVTVGQTLVEIDNREATAQLQRAQAALRQTENGVSEIEESINVARSGKSAAEANKQLTTSTLARYQILLERKSVSPQEFDEVKTRQEVAEAETERAEKMLQMLSARKKQVQAQVDQSNAELSAARVHAGFARVISPIAGIVSVKHIEVGATTTPGAPLLTIEDVAHYRLEASVEESQISRIKLKDPVRVRIESISLEEFGGTVVEILPTSDPSSRSYTVKVAIPGEPLLRSGLYGTARFASGQRQALTVSNEAIVQRGQLSGVFVVDDASVARLRHVKTGKTFSGRMEVLSGLSEGERIVVGGVSRVIDGSRVQ